MILPRIDSVS